jgi:hypothetical protein
MGIALRRLHTAETQPASGAGRAYGIETMKVNWVLDADIRAFFDTHRARVS